MAPVRAFVGAGANLGDAPATVRSAVDRLAHLPRTVLTACSSLYRSAPVQASGGDFINAVAMLHTQLPALTLLHHLQAIECCHGRERPYVNAPRTLDLDLLLYGEHTSSTPELQLPHPRGHQRAFVLLPLFELCPALEWPGHGPVAALLPRVAGQAIEKV